MADAVHLRAKGTRVERVPSQRSKVREEVSDTVGSPHPRRANGMIIDALSPLAAPLPVLRLAGQSCGAAQESRQPAEPGHPQEPGRLRQRPRAHAAGQRDRPARLRGPVHRAHREDGRDGRPLQGERRRGRRAEIEVNRFTVVGRFAID